MRTATWQDTERDSLGQHPLESLIAAGETTSLSGTASVVSLPNFRTLDELPKENPRTLARLNAAQTSEAELASLLSERTALLDKKFDGGLTRTEENRLKFVRWSLDRIEDARHGADLDALEDSIQRYEYFIEKIRHLENSLRNAGNSRRR